MSSALAKVRKSVIYAARTVVPGVPKHSSGLDFSDGANVPLTPNAGAFAGYETMSQQERRERGRGGAHLQRNKSEVKRLQGLMRKPAGGADGLLETDGRATSLGQVESEIKGMKKFKIWMVNEGGRRIFMFVWILVHGMVFTFGFLNYQLKDNLTNARATFSLGYPIARAAAFTLHFDVAFILLPVCRNFISLLRRGPLNHLIPFEKNITFHKQVAWSIVFFTAVHVTAHMSNFIVLAVKSGTGVVGFLGANFLTGPGATGWVMTLALGVMVWYAIEKRRRQPNGGFERFWYSHHLFIVFFAAWQLHGMFCMIQPDTPPFCSWTQIGVFWKWWLVGGLVFIYERILREVRSRHKTYISKVIQHPSQVCEVQIRKEKTTTMAGQYIFLNCPEISYFQWHPFTLTSAPEEDYISVHIRCQGDWTKAFAKSLGCNFDSAKGGEKGGDQPQEVSPISKVLPRVMVDGPFGSASEDVFKFEVAMLCGAGIGVTPFASILKSIWYRINYPQGRPTRLQKVYFFWVCGDYGSFEWFQSLLAAIEEQDLENYIEIHTYLTKVKGDDFNNIYVADVGGDRDAVTGLRAPTHYGRPNWDRIFQSVRDKHPNADTGVMYCGPKALASTLHTMCNKWTSSDEGGTRFFWGKENF